MKRLLIFFLVMLVMLSAACNKQNSDLPPDPTTQPGQGEVKSDMKTGAARYVPDGYAPPEDIFDGDKQIFFLNNYVFNVEPGMGRIDLMPRVTHDDAYIYKFGYIWKNNQWERYIFPGQTVSNSNWIKNDASDYMSFTTSDITPGENYIVAYSCKKHDGEWKCGCRDQNSCGYWMLNTFIYRPVDLPPEPEEPGSPVTTRIYLYPSGDIVEQGTTIDVGASLHSTYDLAYAYTGNMNVQLNGPSGVTQDIILSRQGDPSCNSEDKSVSFNCYLWFNTQYTTSELGKHTLTIGAVPDSTRLFTGYFTVYDSATLDRNTIRQDIGSYIFTKQPYAGYISENGDYESFYAFYDGGSKGASAQIVNSLWNKQNYDDFTRWSGVTKETYTFGTKTYELYTYKYVYSETGFERKEVKWLSQGKLIEVSAWNFNGPAELNDVLYAYLGKYPIEEVPQDNSAIYKLEANMNQPLSSIKSTLGGSEIKTLADGTFKGISAVNYKQQLTVADAKMQYTVDANSAVADPDLYLKFDAGKDIFTYTLTFEQPAQSDAGRGELKDFENQKLSMLGKTYTIVEAMPTTSNMILTLMDGKVQDTLEVDQQKMYTIDGVDYEVKVMVVSGANTSSATTKLIVNDEVTDLLAAGDTFTLKNGIILGIKEIIPTKSGDTIADLVEFYLGANKIVLDGFNNRLQVGDEIIDGATVTISASIDASMASLNSITIKLTPAEAYFTAKGYKLTQSVENQADHYLALEALGIDYMFRSLNVDYSESTSEDVLFTPNGFNSYKLDFTNAKGVKYSLKIAYLDNSSLAKGLGESHENPLKYDIGQVVCDNDYFVVQNNMDSRILQFTAVSDADQRVTLKDVGTGESFDYGIANGSVQFVLDGYTYKAKLNLSSKCLELVDVGGSDDGASIYTQVGTRIFFSNSGPTIYVAEPKKRDGSVGDIIGLSIQQNSRILSLELLPINPNSNFRMITLDSNADMARGVTGYGMKVTKEQASGQNKWTFDIPTEQLDGIIYVMNGNPLLPPSIPSIPQPVVTEPQVAE